MTLKRKRGSAMEEGRDTPVNQEIESPRKGQITSPASFGNFARLVLLFISAEQDIAGM